MVSAIVMASSWSWVTWMNVRPTSVWIRFSSTCIDRRSLRSRAPSGSSSSSTSGWLISARASATRCCWPPESWAGFLRAWLLSSTSSSISLTCLSTSALLAAAQAEGDVLEDVEVREQRVALEDRVDRPPVGLGVGDVLARQRDRAGRRRLEAGDHPQRRGLAAARRAEEGEERAGGYVEVERLHRREVRELLGQLAQLEARAIAARGPGCRVGVGDGVAGVSHL